MRLPAGPALLLLLALFHLAEDGFGKNQRQQTAAQPAVAVASLMNAEQAGEKLALRDSTKGDVIMKLVPLIDNFEAAKNAIKVNSDAEQKIVDSYQVSSSTGFLFPAVHPSRSLPSFIAIA